VVSPTRLDIREPQYVMENFRVADGALYTAIIANSFPAPSSRESSQNTFAAQWFFSDDAPAVTLERWRFPVMPP
jgi:hypothetical protein